MAVADIADLDRRLRLRASGPRAGAFRRGGAGAAERADAASAADFAAVRDRLPAGMSEAAWLAVRPNIATLAEASRWWRVIEGPIAPPALDADDRAFCAQAADVAAAIDWREAPWAGAHRRAQGRDRP